MEDKRAINVARAENYYETLYKKRSDEYLAFVTKYKWYSILATNIPTLFSAFLTAVTIGIASVLYFEGKATIGTVFVVFPLSQLLRVLSSDCDVIVLDEPFTNFDHETIGCLSNHIASRRKKKSIIAIMHSPELDQAADVILKINKEKILCDTRRSDSVSC